MAIQSDFLQAIDEGVSHGGFIRLQWLCMNDFVLSEQTHAFIRFQKWEVAVLPFGATEPHNFHMPYGTDNYEVDVVGRRVCEYAYKRGAKAVLLPTMPLGVNT